MGIDNLGKHFGKKTQKFLEDFGADEGHAEVNPHNALRAALIAAGATIAAPSEAHAGERADPIAEIIHSDQRKQLNDLIHTIERDRPVLEKLFQSITVQKHPDQKDQDEIACLAKNIYYEGNVLKKQSERESIGLVTLLRVISKQFPNSVCGVVYQRWNTKSPEFSWTKDEEKRDGMPSDKTYMVISELAKDLYQFRENPAALKKRAAELGISPETLYYKHFAFREHDPNDRNMSEHNKWWWRTCVTPELDASGKHVQHGPHQFYRPSEIVCGSSKKRQQPLAPEKPLRKSKKS